MNALWGCVCVSVCVCVFGRQLTSEYTIIQTVVKLYLQFGSYSKHSPRKLRKHIYAVWSNSNNTSYKYMHIIIILNYNCITLNFVCPFTYSRIVSMCINME